MNTLLKSLTLISLLLTPIVHSQSNVNNSPGLNIPEIKINFPDNKFYLETVVIYELSYKDDLALTNTVKKLESTGFTTATVADSLRLSTLRHNVLVIKPDSKNQVLTDEVLTNALKENGKINHKVSLEGISKNGDFEPLATTLDVEGVNKLNASIKNDILSRNELGIYKLMQSYKLGGNGITFEGTNTFGLSDNGAALTIINVYDNKLYLALTTVKIIDII